MFFSMSMQIWGNKWTLVLKYREDNLIDFHSSDLCMFIGIAETCGSNIWEFVVYLFCYATWNDSRVIMQLLFTLLNDENIVRLKVPYPPPLFLALFVAFVM